MPSIAAQYNLHIGAVDIGDQLRACAALNHRGYKGNWRAMAWKFLLEISLVNSSLLQRFKKPTWATIESQVEWRERLVEDTVSSEPTLMTAAAAHCFAPATHLRPYHSINISTERNPQNVSLARAFGLARYAHNNGMRKSNYSKRSTRTRVRQRKRGADAPRSSRCALSR